MLSRSGGLDWVVYLSSSSIGLPFQDTWDTVRNMHIEASEDVQNDARGFVLGEQ